MKHRGIALARNSAMLAIACGLCFTSVTASGAEPRYPARPIKVIVPTGAGANLDITTRQFSQKMGEMLGQPMVVENQPGASSLGGTRFVAKSVADGYTLLAMSNTFSAAMSVVLDPGYDPVREFSGIGLMTWVPVLLAVDPNLPARSVPELIALAKQKPDALSYGSSGSGSFAHIAAAMFSLQAGVKMLHVPYKATAPALTDVMAGRVSLIFDPIVTSGAYARAGKMRALAITTSKRSPLFPDLPTIAESGFPGYDLVLYTGLVAPANTPRDVLLRLNGTLVKAMSIPELRDPILQSGVEFRPSDLPEQFGDFIKAEVARYAKVVKEAGIKPE